MPTRLDTRNGPATGACGGVAVAERDDEPFGGAIDESTGGVDNQNDTNSYGTRFEPHGYDDDNDDD